MMEFLGSLVVGLLAFAIIISGISKHAKNITLFTKVKHRLKGAPAFSPHLIDCYVKFYGRVATPNQNTTPLKHQPCVWYQSKVFAQWQTKAKKPQKGMVTNRKMLYEQQSSGSSFIELIAENGTKVIVNVNAFNQKGNVIEVDHDKRTLSACPAVCINQAQSKYKQYSSVEKWLENDALVMIYGKLNKGAAGQLSLSPTTRNDYPSIFKVVSKSGRKLDAEISKKLSGAKMRLFLWIVVFIAALFILAMWLQART